MTDKLDFTPQEWTKVLESVALVGIAVSAADPNGLWGLTKEALASRSALIASKHDGESNELIKAVITDFESKAGRSVVLEALHKRFAGAETADILSVHSKIFVRFRHSSVPRLPTTQLPSRACCLALAKKWLRPPWNIASSVLGAF